MIANSGFKSVSRMGYNESTQGWLVKIYWKRKWYRKYFADRKNGGKLQALQDAVKWRDETELQIGKPQTDRVVVGKPARGKMAGIRKTTINQKKNGKVYTYPAYVVYWFPEAHGKRKQTSFSIKRYGELKAKKMAMELRDKMYKATCLQARS